MNERRREAALRVAATYPPLPQIFAALRASLGESDDPLATAFAAAADGATDADDLALALALAGEETFAACAAEGARAAGRADTDVRDVAVDAVLAELQPYAAEVVAGTAPAMPPPGLLDRLRDAARSAGAAAATTA